MNTSRSLSRAMWTVDPHRLELADAAAGRLGRAANLPDHVRDVFTWLVPITTGEAEVIQKFGWGTLEQAFAAQDPDLADPGRAEVALDGLGS
ncbi:hypothetical protein [Micromonospora chersina]|uniref:hypothetical protein n=1 Tax=Micromonospora chersina TaxID=47854 RepID=UPI0033D8F316